MKVCIKAKTKKQKEELHKGIFEAISRQMERYYWYNDFDNYQFDQREGDYDGCTIKLVDNYSDRKLTRRMIGKKNKV